MILNKIILSCALLALSSSLYASDAGKNVASFNKANNKLEKNAIKNFKACNKEASCVEKTYAEFKDQRDKLVKKNLKAKPKAFNKAAKNTLKKEEKCIMKNGTNAKKCFKNNDAGISKAADEIAGA